MTRPIWTLMSRLPIYKNAQCGDLKNSLWLYERYNIPSSVIMNKIILIGGGGHCKSAIDVIEQEAVLKLLEL